MVDAVEIARERIRQYQAEIARLNVFVEMAESLVRDNQLPSHSVVANSPISSPTVMPPMAYGADRSSPTKEVLAQAEERFKQLGKPQQAADIYDWLVLHGVAIAGKNPKGNLTAKFATRKDIFSFDKVTGLWSLTEWTKAKTNEAPTEQSESASKLEIPKARDFKDLL